MAESLWTDEITKGWRWAIDTASGKGNRATLQTDQSGVLRCRSNWVPWTYTCIAELFWAMLRKMTLFPDNFWLIDVYVGGGVFLHVFTHTSVFIFTYVSTRFFCIAM